MSLLHSIEQAVSLGKDAVCFIVRGGAGVLCGFFPLVTRRHYRHDVGACSVQGCCANSARPGLLDQNIWSDGNLFQRLG